MIKWCKTKKVLHLNGTQQEKYMAKIIRDTPITLKDLAKVISKNSTMGEGDVYGVLIELRDKMGDYLKEGHSVNIPEFGTFYVAITSKAEAKEEEVSEASIKNTTCRFRASNELRKGLIDTKKKFIDLNEIKHI